MNRVTARDAHGDPIDAEWEPGASIARLTVVAYVTDRPGRRPVKMRIVTDVGIDDLVRFAGCVAAWQCRACKNTPCRCEP